VGAGFIGGQASAAFDLFKLDAGFLPVREIAAGQLAYNERVARHFPSSSSRSRFESPSQK
jgi:hypothetical protein